MGMIKTAREIALIRKAAAIANSCMPVIEKALREEGITERELARAVRRKIYSQGGRLSFSTLVGSGPRSAMIHTVPPASDRIISGIGYVDFGASWKGYKVDVTVPFIKGKIKTRERKIVTTVLQAYNIAVRTCKTGMLCSNLHRKVDSFISSRGLEMKHALGHGIGKNLRVSYHESPTIFGPDDGLQRKAEKLAKKGSRRARRALRRWARWGRVRFRPNMAITIEPGAYVGGVGGSRIENTFLVTGKSLKALTKANLIEV